MLDRQGKKTERMTAVREARQASVRPRHQSLSARSRFLTRSRLRAVSRPRRSVSRVELTSAFSKIGIGDIGAAKVRAAELAAVQLGASETRVAQRGELEHGARKVGVLEARAVEPRRAKHAAHQPHRLFAHVGGEIGTIEAGACHAGPGEVAGDARIGKIGAVELGADAYVAAGIPPARGSGSARHCAHASVPPERTDLGTSSCPSTCPNQSPSIYS